MILYLHTSFPWISRNTRTAERSAISGCLLEGSSEAAIRRCTETNLLDNVDDVPIRILRVLPNVSSERWAETVCKVIDDLVCQSIRISRREQQPGYVFSHRLRKPSGSGCYHRKSVG